MKRLFKAILMHSVLGRWLGKLPFTKNLYLRYVWPGRMNVLFGIFDSFSHAERFAGSISNVGWEDEKLAKMVVPDAGSAAPQMFQTSQFAVMLWLSKLMRRGDTILDFGGGGGGFYEICNRYGLLEAPLRWHIVDMPDIVERGRERHEALQSRMITFGSVLADAPHANTMLMLGVMQYLPDPLGEEGLGLLETLPTLPEHILINKIPLTDTPDAWTVQNLVSSVSAYRFFNRKRFMEYFESHGYSLKDRWSVPEVELEIPFHPERTMSGLEGLYFKRGITEKTISFS
jgi:putative methyltransferase (TIGR04325 family)